MEKSNLAAESSTGEAESADFIYAPAGAKQQCLELYDK